MNIINYFINLLFRFVFTFKIILNGESGSIGIESKKLSVGASANIKIEADGNVKISGRQVSTEATSLLKNESSGMLTLNGKPIKLG